MNDKAKTLKTLLASFGLVFSVACGGDDVETPDEGENEQEVITTVRLTFMPTSGTNVVAEFLDADGDGGNAPTIDDIQLTNGMNYTLSVAFENALETPAEDITEEIEEEDAEHQVFFFGSAVTGPANPNNNAAVLSHAYTDQDAGGLPVGLANTIEAVQAGSGTMTVMLRHLPEQAGTAQKVAGLAGDLATSGEAALPGDVDAQVDFQVTVQ